MKKFITYQESIQKLQKLDIDQIFTQEVFISDSLDRVLAEDIIANEDFPKYPTSSMDGYAIRYDDQKFEKLKILRDNPAGSEIEDEVSEGVCIKTFTGSLMPKGSDTLIPIENVEVSGDEIIIKQEVIKDFAVRKVGENYFKGEVLIKKGTKIGYAEIGVMAGLNISNVKVTKKPIVAVASTGSEILDVGEKRTNEAQIRSSNHLTIEALVKKFGAEPIQMGVVKDDRDTITKVITKALESADIVVTTGGVSVGDYDFVKDVVKDTLGADVVFQGVSIKPGQHVLLAKKDQKIILSLPGFAFSSTVTFVLYGVPIILKMLGLKGELEMIDATLKQDLKKRSPKTTFSTCNISIDNGEYYIDFENKKQGSSAILTNMLYNSGLVIQEGDIDINTKGEKVKVIKI